MKYILTLYKYTEKEQKQLLKTITIIIDSREKENSHIRDYFDKKGISYIVKALNWGDYSFYLPKNDELDIKRDIYFDDNIVIERKMSLEELSGNLAQHRERFEDELRRASSGQLTLMIEKGSVLDITCHNYRTDYNEKSYLASLLALQQRYGFHIDFVTKDISGSFIHAKFHYYLRELIK